MSILKINNLSIKVDNNLLLDDVSFKISPGDFILISGKNGSGKSTFLKVLVNDISEYKNIEYNGKITFNDGENIFVNEAYRREFNSSIVYVEQQSIFPTKNVLDFLLLSILKTSIENKELYVFNFLIQNSIFESINVVKSKLNMSKKRFLKKINREFDSLSIDELKTLQLLFSDPSKLSGGQKKLISIVSGLLKSDYIDVFIIDEPLNSLDYQTMKLVSNSVTKIHHDNPNIVFIVTSHLKFLPSVNRVLHLNKKRKTILPDDDNTLFDHCFGEIDSRGFYID